MSSFSASGLCLSEWNRTITHFISCICYYLQLHVNKDTSGGWSYNL